MEKVFEREKHTFLDLVMVPGSSHEPLLNLGQSQLAPYIVSRNLKSADHNDFPLILFFFVLVLVLLLDVVCEPAGPGFDAHPGNAEPLHVAYHSQCFHTDAGNYGTSDRSCHQDWILGECGNRQAAAG